MDPVNKNPKKKKLKISIFQYVKSHFFKEKIARGKKIELFLLLFLCIFSELKTKLETSNID